MDVLVSLCQLQESVFGVTEKTQLAAGQSKAKSCLLADLDAADDFNAGEERQTQCEFQKFYRLG